MPTSASPADKGRFQVTSTTSDEYVFTAYLQYRATPLYFHSGVLGFKCRLSPSAATITGAAELAKEASIDVPPFRPDRSTAAGHLSYPPPSS